jgi:uncharacterized protein
MKCCLKSSKRQAALSCQDQLLVNSEGNSYISYADYAIINEIELPKHQNRRFTVVGEAK